MIDTFAANLEARLHPGVPEALKHREMSEWNLISDGRRLVGKRLEDRVVAVHKLTGLRVVLSGAILRRIEMSFPRLVPLCPERQCRNEADMSFRWDNLFAILATLGPNMRHRHFTFTRIDLALTLDLNPRQVLPLHRNARHRLIRRETECYYNDRPGVARKGKVPYRMDTLNSVVFNGSYMRISLYDKVSEVCKYLTEVPDFPTGLRVEIQIKQARRIAALFGKRPGTSVSITDLSLAKCYGVYRDILGRFETPRGRRPAKLDLASCLDILERHPESWQNLSGMRPLDAYRLFNEVGDEQFRRMRRDVSAVEFGLEGFLWSDVLPANRLPAMVDIGTAGTPLATL
jgi:hypothetical protein